jgi:hypothetical protein
MRKASLWGLCLLAVSAAGSGHAQSTNAGDIRGTVTDQSGALIPEVTVTVLNVETGVAKDYVTNSDGVYDTSSIVTGQYQITFTKTGFNRLVRGPVTVQVGLTGVNAQLKIGSTAQQVVVTDNVPLLQTETGEQSTTLEAKSMAQLPNVGTDWQNFTILLPGTSGTPSGQATGSPASNPGQFVAANGNLPYNAMLADGSTTTLPSSSNSDVSTFETVAELEVSTSSFSAQYGIGGYIFNQISKGGTDQFHGAVYEYFQNDALNAKGYGFGEDVTVPFLRYNNYGGSIGGPILKKKMFFYFNFEKLSQHGSNTGFLTVPTQAELNGDFTGQPTIYDPTTQVVTQTPDGPVVTRQSFADEYGNGNKIPANLIDPVAKAIQSYYPKPNVNGNVSQGAAINNYFYNALNSSPFTKYFGRLDYDITPTNRLTISDTQRDSPAVQNQWDTCPIGCDNVDTDSNNSQITDVWNISPSAVNEARVGFTDQLNYYVDSTLNQGFPSKLGWKFAKFDQFPTISIGGNCCFGLAPNVNAVQKEMVFDFSDVVTLIRGRHILHFGGELLLYRTDTTTWGNFNGGTFGFTGQYTQSTVGDSTTGLGYADFLLGQSQSWSALVAPEYGPRAKNPQVFVQDDFKIRPNLTLNLGIRYQIMTGWTEVKNNISAFDPTVVNPETGTDGALWYAATHANGRKSLQASAYSTVLPRVGFSWLPHPNTTIRGGFGIFAYRWSLDTYGTGMGTALQFQGNATDQTNGISPVTTLSSNGSELPYIGPTTDPAALNGQGVVYNKYHTPVPEIYQWNLAVQREFGANTVGEVAYVASHAHNLSFPVDINQVPEDKLGPNDSPSALPYPIYQSITGDTFNGLSNYNSLQASISRRFASGLSLNLNYTWAHFLDDQDSSGYGGAAGTQTVQRSYDPAASYGSSNFDVRNAFKGRVVYELPFGKGKMFLNKSGLLDSVIGGWQASGTFVLSSGFPFTPTVDGNNSFSQAGDWYPNQIGNPKPSHRSIDQWFDPTAYALPEPGTFGNMRRNSLRSPGIDVVNLSAGKSFALGDRLNLQIRADTSNAFNHPSFGLPNMSLEPSGGTGADSFVGSATNITTTTVGGRTMQLNARISF